MEIFWRFFEIGVYLFEGAVFCYFIQKHFPGRFSLLLNRIINVLIIMAYAGLHTLYLYFPVSWIANTAGMVIVWLLYAVLFRKGPRYQKSFWAVLVVGINGICASAAVTWTMYIHWASRETIAFEQGISKILLAASVKLIQIMFIYYFSRLYMPSRTPHKKINVTMISLLLLCLFINTALMDIGMSTGDNLQLMFSLSLSATFVLAVLIIMYSLYNSLTNQSEILLNVQSELQHKVLMEEHNEELLKIEANMRTWRHDFHNHLQSLLVLSREGDRDKIQDYIYTLGHSLKETEGVCHTGQQALDAIVTVKCALAKADGIKVNIHITPIAPLPINNVDVTSLLGNLFDNAIEACRRVEPDKRLISLFFNMMENMICIRMQNPTEGRARMEDGRFLTTKPHSGLHGLGLPSIDRIMASSRGIVRRELKDGVFTTVLLLPVKG